MSFKFNSVVTLLVATALMLSAIYLQRSEGYQSFFSRKANIIQKYRIFSSVHTSAADLSIMVEVEPGFYRRRIPAPAVIEQAVTASIVQEAPSEAAINLEVANLESTTTAELDSQLQSQATPYLIAADEMELNFEDTSTLCTSEGGTWKIKPAETISSSSSTKASSSSIASVADISIEDTDLNFQDPSALCTSEGGNWKVNLAALPDSVSRPTGAAVEEEDGAKAFLEIMTIIMKGVLHRMGVVLNLFSFQPLAADIVKLCDKIDDSNLDYIDSFLFRWRRQSLLLTMLERDRKVYIETVSFLQSRIPRLELPNLQDIPVSETRSATSLEEGLVADCTLPKVTYSESLLDKFLLSIFRGLVQQEIGWKSDTQGIKGLLEEGRHYMLSEEGTPENQHAFVRRTLAGLMTPFLPPFYRIFMSGIVPSKERGDPEWLVSSTNQLIGNLPDTLKDKVSPGKQFGPWFYAPFLTSVVTPPFLNFLVGPSRINYRKDGQLGGIVVDKCKFLQESGCKGLCLHQCKLPAQQFFANELGLDLTVTPNFETQECQWSWGEKPLPADEDPAFPKGCLAGCATRPAIAALKLTEGGFDKSNICSA